jgi:UDP-N-acetylmuramoyl-L-alanyl-D-glutamate--2,6-diaminopimelate ligase
MQVLNNILEGVTVKKLKGQDTAEVKDLCIDSRKVTQGSAFIAVHGTNSDGHSFIAKAIGMGATVIVCEQMPAETVSGITYVHVPNSHEAAGQIASAFYGRPSSAMKVVGITGTNGKTTTATLLFQLFRQLGYRCGLISTVQNHIHDDIESSTHTTPDAISVQALLSRMANAECSHVFMEVSSHAVHQKRIAGIDFAGGVFTNITHDHLDYHKTFDEYIRVKKQFFDGLSLSAFALTNADDKRGFVILQNTVASKNSYSLKAPATFKGKVLENNLTGLVMQIDNIEAHFRMIGTFNAYNLLAVYGTAVLLGEDKINVLAALSNLQGAPGRFETIMSANQKVLGIVDYAHTPDALLNVLATINQLRTKGQNLITVIGCGGDRDRTKRPVMAEVATEHSNKIILTSDNPRSEDPEEILNEMIGGLSVAQKGRVLRITDRKEAIKTACALALEDDIILVAGKGHETYQEIKGVKYPFDDKEILEEAFELLNK